MTAPPPPGRRPAAPPRLSVIVPTLDEEARIGAHLDALLATPGVDQVIVADGGSRDRTEAIARARPGVRVTRAPRGRARQMNHGAALATGELLIFLHADVSLPPGAPALVRGTLAEPGVVAGAFRTWTVADQAPSLLAPLLHLADLRSRVTTLPYGDQALFVRAAVFRAAGGFPDLPILEDLELSRMLSRLGRVRILRQRVRVSGRRFLRHPIYYAALVNAIPLLHRLGAPLPLLARLYRDPR